MKRGVPRIAVIGAGVFGATCALRLAPRYHVTVFERNDEILGGASWGNQNRHHFGYHYPRSPETVLQCRKTHGSFEAFYGSALVWDVESYYCVSSAGSRTSPDDYVRFCDEYALPYQTEYPEEDHLRRSKVGVCLRVPEPVFDFWDLKGVIEKRLGAEPNIHLRLTHEVVGGSVKGDGQKRLEVRYPGGALTQDFDVVINASFYEINTVWGWFGFPRRNFQYDTKELAIVRLPTSRRIGITVMDGPFCTVLPMGRTDRFILGHVRESLLSRDVSETSPDGLGRSLGSSRWPMIRDASAEFLPFISRCEFVEPMFTRVVLDPDSADDDARISEVTNHGRGCWTVFSAKIVSCVAVADEVGSQVDAYLGFTARSGFLGGTW